MKKNFKFFIMIIFLFLINSLVAFSERIIDNLEQMEERVGKTYVRGEKEAFTGTIRIYEEGNWLFSEAPFKNGLRDGVQKDYYKNGKREGSAKSFYENGNVEFEENHINGLQNGTMKEYYENGKIKSERPMKMGKKDGISKNYYENGILKLELILKDGKPVGNVLTYDEKGNLISKEKY